MFQVNIRVKTAFFCGKDLIVSSLKLKVFVWNKNLIGVGDKNRQTQLGTKVLHGIWLRVKSSTYPYIYSSVIALIFILIIGHLPCICDYAL